MRKSLLVFISILTVIVTGHLMVSQPVLAVGPPQHIPIKGIFAPPADSNSSILEDGSDIVEITPDKEAQKGAIWSLDNYKMDLTHNFSSLMYINLGDHKNKAGDGMAFVMMNDINKVARWGQNGGGSIGVWRDQKPGEVDTVHIDNSFAVEFDTFFNATAANGEMDAAKYSKDQDGKDVLMPGEGEKWLWDKEEVRGRGHVAYSFPGDEASYQEEHGQPVLIHHNVQYPKEKGAFLSNGNWHSFKIDWNSEKKELSYRFDGWEIQTVHLDPQKIFKTDHVYWGFTGATGGKHELNQVVFTEVPGLNDLESPSVVKSWQGKTFSEIEKGTLGHKGPSAALTRKTVHYVINPSDATTSAKDITHLVAKMHLDHTTYVKGSLQANPSLKNADGSAIDDSKWTKDLEIPIGTLTHDKPTKMFEFDATVDPLAEGELSAEGMDTITYSSDLLLNKTFKLPYTVRNDMIHVTDAKGIGKLQLTAYDVSRLRTLGSSKAVAQELARMAGLKAVRVSDDTVIGLDKFETTEDALAAMYGLLPGSNVTLHFQAPDYGLPSDSLAFTFFAPDDDGALTFKHVEPTTTFANARMGQAQAAMHSGKWETTVSDTRAYGSEWQLMLALTKPFTLENSEHPLAGQLVYIAPDGTPTPINAADTPIVNGDNNRGTTEDITAQWTSSTGLALEKIGNYNYAGTYTGQLTWTLSDVPH